MAIIDEIEELRAELRHCRLSARERHDAEAQLAELIRKRAASEADETASVPIRSPHGE